MATTKESSSAAPAPRTRYFVEETEIEFDYDDEGCYESIDRCCVKPPPGNESSSSGSSSSSSGSSSGSGIGEGPNPHPCPGQADPCSHDWCTFDGGASLLDDGSSGECTPPDSNTPSADWLRHFCHLLGQPGFPDQLLAQTACYYLGHPYPSPEACASPTLLFEIRWCDTILPLWRQYVQTTLGIDGGCLGIGGDGIDPPPTAEVWEIDLDYKVVGRRCYEVTHEDLCKMLCP